MDGQFSHCRFNLLGYHTNAMKHTDIGSTCINRTAENEDGWLTGFRTDADNFNLVQGEIRQIHAIPFCYEVTIVKGSHKKFCFPWLATFVLI